TSYTISPRPPSLCALPDAPGSTIVRAMSLHGFTALFGSPLKKAPEVGCPQLTKPVTAAQSAFAVHATGRHGAPLHATHGTPTAHVQAAPDARPLHRRANVLRLLFLQKPQNTFASSGRSTDVLLTVPERSTHV